MIKIIFIIILGFPVVLLGQTKLGIPFSHSKLDSLYFQVETDTYYNYFYGKNDTLFDLVSDKKMPVTKTLVVDSVSGNGCMKIIFKNRLLYKYQIINYQITGLGLHYNSLISHENNLAFEQGVFFSGKLNGSYIRLDVNNKGALIADLIYRNGRLIKINYSIDYDGKKKKYWIKSHSYP